MIIYHMWIELAIIEFTIGVIICIILEFNEKRKIGDRIRGFTRVGLVQAGAGTFLMFYGLWYMIFQSLVEGIAIVGVGITRYHLCRN